MAIIVKPPTPFEQYLQPKLFLAGTIDDGQAENWQVQAAQYFNALNIVILNPRRDDWDSTWVQSIHNATFKEQVTWELQGQEEANAIMMYFAPHSKSPITLLEFGLFAHSQKLHVCCPDGFWRKGNIEVVCERYSIPLYQNFPACLHAVHQLLTT